jgi:hypothetical protein
MKEPAASSGEPSHYVTVGTRPPIDSAALLPERRRWAIGIAVVAPAGCRNGNVVCGFIALEHDSQASWRGLPAQQHSALASCWSLALLWV